MIPPCYHGLLVMILVQRRPSSTMGKPAELYLMIHSIDQVSFVFISSFHYILVTISEAGWRAECALNADGCQKVSVYHACVKCRLL